ncbi:hypothetical protein KAS42_02535 [bacterium]|nr:hypothetical protein [bacterium]
MMKKEWYMKTIVGVVALTICLLVAESCKKSDDKAVKIIELSRQIVPLQICRDEKNVETITLNQAMNWHENHEHEQHKLEKETAIPSEEEIQTSQKHHHFCLGVLTGYQAIRYATDELFQEDVPKTSDFDIKVSGSMNGVWDIMSFYTGRELKFEGDPKKINLESFTFTAKRISQNKFLVFRLQRGLIPKEFFELKNQGATCSSPALRKVKQQALLNILSAEPKDCFQVINAK